MLRYVFDRFEGRPWPDAQGEDPRHTQQRRTAMRQVLERFVKGHALVLARDIKELGSRDRAQHMRGYWEFRSQGRMTETRLFGFFARPGAFIATDFQSRDLYTGQADWDDQRARCGAQWSGLTDKDWYVGPWPVELRAHLATYLDRDDD
jgi:hypothetical protein